VSALAVDYYRACHASLHQPLSTQGSGQVWTGSLLCMCLA
jgi:hypothetical protein